MRAGRDAVWPHCSVCNKRLFFRSDKAADLQRLKPLREYETAYDGYRHLCERCWTKITTIQCDLCRTSSDVFAFDNQIDTLRQNLETHAVELAEVSSARRVCPKCCERRLHSRCDRCSRPFLSACNAAASFRSDADAQRCLAPYHKDYGNWSLLCFDCYEACRASCQDVQMRLSQWKGSARGEYVRDFRTVEELGRVEYEGAECDEPEKVEERLKLYTAQLGGNAFVKYYWEKHEERDSRSVLAGHSRNGNPYYRTEYSTERWFTGHATAVIVESSVRPRAAPIIMADGPINAKVKQIVLDGLNIGCWASPGGCKPDLRILVTLALELTHKKLPFIVFFDANTPHALSDDESVVAYKRVISDLPRIFVEVTGRMRADEFILQRANSDSSHVISNDQFRDYAERYPWVLAGDRLIKGAVAGDRILIPRLDFDLRIMPDVAAVADVLVKTIELQRCRSI